MLKLQQILLQKKSQTDVQEYDWCHLNNIWMSKLILSNWWDINFKNLCSKICNNIHKLMVNKLNITLVSFKYKMAHIKFWP